ncbi:hypothetical protein FKP32DRAFT_824097 [Trametes sanguinea]|nr:hypothetical protein FKP32DRAFT_824097 [Trametes sanguinea]
MILGGGLSIFDDSGVPIGQTGDYTTVVIIHGLIWHGGTFAKLRPIARTLGVRVIALNRRDYPGARPYTAEERAILPSIPEDLKLPMDSNGTPLGTNTPDNFLRQRARELYDGLQALVEECNIPPLCPTSRKGGIVLVGWSLGCTWISALLSHVSAFPVGRIRLTAYIRRVVWQDPLSYVLGYPSPQDAYSPVLDTSLSLEERNRLFMKWLTSHYSHKRLDSPDGLERRTPLDHPLSTFDAMSQEERGSTMHVLPGAPGGSDWDVLFGCYFYGTFRKLRKGALFPPDAVGKGEDWRDIELRVLWGDQSVWATPYAITRLRQELGQADQEWKSHRPVNIVLVKGANHFAHWHHPELTLESHLTDKPDCNP